MSRTLATSLALAAILLGSASPVLGQVARPAPAKAASKAPAVVNLNTATAAEIATLPGIGAATAQRIVEHRAKHGPFKKIEELMNVKGIGEKSFLKLKPYLSVEDGKAAARQ